jgi:hypothetical protein
VTGYELNPGVPGLRWTVGNLTDPQPAADQRRTGVRTSLACGTGAAASDDLGARPTPCGNRAPATDRTGTTPAGQPETGPAGGAPAAPGAGTTPGAGTAPAAPIAPQPAPSTSGLPDDLGGLINGGH